MPLQEVGERRRQRRRNAGGDADQRRSLAAGVWRAYAHTEGRRNGEVSHVREMRLNYAPLY